MSGFTSPLSAEILRLFATTQLGGPVTNPDLGFQLSVCVNPMAEQLIMQALRTMLMMPVPVGGQMISLLPPSTMVDIRTNCLDGERIGVWFPTAPAAGRDEALRLPSRLQPGENYVQTISLNGIRFIADAVWNNPATPKRINLPDPFPAAQLTSLEINLVPPNRIVTTINGRVPITILPDISFRVIFTDVVALDGAGRLVCMPEQPQVNASAVTALAPLRLIIDPIAQSAFAGQVNPMAGLGCRVLTALAPGNVAVPVCGTISFPYSRLDLDGAGVTLGSRAPLHPCLMAARVMEEPFRAPR
jgi:hypothetical protein